MKISAYAVTNIGRVRSKNQDNYICGSFCSDISGGKLSHELRTDTSVFGLFGVFDGMGGHLYGERASRIALDTASELLSDYSGETPERFFEKILALSNERICREMAENVKGRMGTTASLLALTDDRYYLTDIGDSPIFLIRDHRISQISLEHSERRNYEEVFGTNYDHSKKFKLTQHLGILPEEMELDPYYYSSQAFPGDVFLICSDGLTDMVSESAVLQTVESGMSIKQICDTLVRMALENGGRDNITVVLLKTEEQPAEGRGTNKRVASSQSHSEPPSTVELTRTGYPYVGGMNNNAVNRPAASPVSGSGKAAGAAYPGKSVPGYDRQYPDSAFRNRPRSAPMQSARPQQRYGEPVRQNLRAPLQTSFPPAAAMKKNNGKKTALIIIIAILTLALGIAIGYLLATSFNSGSSQIEESAVSQSQSSSVAQTETESYSDGAAEPDGMI